MKCLSVSVRDTLYLLGDLVNRGPDSLGVLRSLTALGDAAQCLLGNHDLHLLALWQGVCKPGRKDTVQAVLQAPDSQALLDWLRHRAMALHRHGWLMVPAGVLPQWSAVQALALATEVEQVLRGPDLKGFLSAMYGNAPTQWHDRLEGADRLRVIVNALTRLRFCTQEGVMEFTSSEGASGTPHGYMPWFEVPGRATQAHPWLLGIGPPWPQTQKRPQACGTTPCRWTPGCVWGGCLTAARLEAAAGEFELVSVKCKQAQKPA